jgi:hypothetical protein
MTDEMEKYAHKYYDAISCYSLRKTSDLNKSLALIHIGVELYKISAYQTVNEKNEDIIFIKAACEDQERQSESESFVILVGQDKTEYLGSINEFNQDHS